MAATSFGGGISLMALTLAGSTYRLLIGCHVSNKEYLLHSELHIPSFFTPPEKCLQSLVMITNGFIKSITPSVITSIPCNPSVRNFKKHSFPAEWCVEGGEESSSDMPESFAHVQDGEHFSSMKACCNVFNG